MFMSFEDKKPIALSYCFYSNIKIFCRPFKFLCTKKSPAVALKTVHNSKLNLQFFQSFVSNSYNHMSVALCSLLHGTYK